MKKIRLKEDDDVWILDEYSRECGMGCGRINNDGNLYFIDKNKMQALLIPDKYKDTPICSVPFVGGYDDGLIMVSLLGEAETQYPTNYRAGKWGWIDLEGNEVIPPKYIYASRFMWDKAIVCEGDWDIDKEGLYWCDNERWGIIDKCGNDILPCIFEEFYDVDYFRYIICSSVGQNEEIELLFDLEEKGILLNIDFSFDYAYKCNDSSEENDYICFEEPVPKDDMTYIYVFSVNEKKWVAYRERYEEIEIDHFRSKIVIRKDGKEMIFFKE